MRGRVLEGARLASECMALIESIGDPDLMVGLSFATILAKCEHRRVINDALQWSQGGHRLGWRRPHQGEHHHRLVR